MVQSGNSFYAYALHCNGQHAFICNTTDTFMINPLPTGTYTFRFGVDAGQGPSPCTPGIVPGPDDSIQFTVNTTTSINTPSPTTPEIYLDAAADLLNVGLMSSGFSDLSIDIYNVLGKKIITKKIIENKSRINVSTLPDGVYIVKIYGNGIHHTGRFLKRN